MLAHATDGDDQPIDVRRVRNDIVGLFTAGTETTALALTWTIVVLGTHPDVAERVASEVEQVVGSGPVKGEHVRRLEYTRMVLEETLRMYPPGWMIPRTLQSSDALAGVDLPAGTTVVLSPYMTHRLPDLWPDPERFDPGRFLPGSHRTRPRYSYFPFGGGMHQCLGQAFFFYEAALAVAAILSRLRLRVVTPQPIRPTVSVSLHPKDKILVRLEKVQPG